MRRGSACENRPGSRDRVQTHTKNPPGRPPAWMLGVFSFVVVCADLLQASPALYKEVNVIGGWSDEDGWVSEFNSLRNSLGVEYFKRLANDYGDFLTLDVQARISSKSSGSHEERWALEVHNLWADWKLGLGSSVRLGHFEPAYCLGPSVDTHGTLLQTLAMTDVGFTHDWGVGYRAAVGLWDLDAALGLGTGMGIHRRDRSLLLPVRLTKPAGTHRQYGFSALYSNVLTSHDHRTIPPPDMSDTTTTKKRIGAHGLCGWGPFVFGAETTVGLNEDDEVAGALGPIDYTIPPLQALTLQGQAWVWSADLARARAQMASFSLGATWRISPSLAVRAAAFRQRSHHGRTDARIIGQVYYYGR